MTHSIEQRVVQMKFDNAAFEQRVAQSLRTLDSLNKKLSTLAASKGLSGIGAAATAQTASLKSLEHGVQAIGDRFKAMSVVAITALSTVTSQLVSAAGRWIKSVTLDPITQGFKEYETKIGSIQTILANTAHAGTNLKQVTAALDQLNHYSDQTIYNFGEMAKNIGTFTAAGVSLDAATNSIKGIANLAAVSGSTSQQASTAMYQLSQSISAGKVSLEDWNSVVNAGMGGKVFQDSLIETARVHGVGIDQMIKDEGSFRLTLQKGWLTGDILTETLSKFTGDLTDAQLKTMGYNEKQIAGIQKMAKVAVGAATEVKTMSQLVSTVKESVGSGWSKTWELIFGDFNEAKGLFTDVNDAIGDVVSNSADGRNKMLSDWKELGGRTAVIDGISNAVKALSSVLKPIGQAFREIFPATTGKQLAEASIAFRNFTAGLAIGGTAANNLRRTFAGFFALLDIGWMIVKGVVTTLFTLIGVATEGSGGFLEFTGSIGDFIVSLRNTLKEGGKLTNFFAGIGRALSVPIRLIQTFAKFIGSLFKEMEGSEASKDLGGLAKKLEPLGRIGQTVIAVWSKILTVMTNVSLFFQKIGAMASDFFGEFGQGVADMFSGLDFGDVLSGINTGLFAGLVLMLRNFIGGGGAGGIIENISEAFENFTGVLGAMQNTLRAATLLQIAIAVGVLALAMNKLAQIDAAGLTRGGVAIGAMFAILIGALLAFEKLSGFVGFAKMPFVALSMILLAAAINILATAATKLAALSWEGIAKGLTGLVVILASLIATTKLMSNPAKLILTALALNVLAKAIHALQTVVADMGSLSWEDMAKGLIGVGALLAGLTLFTKMSIVSKGARSQSLGLILLAVGIKILASAMQDFSSLSWEGIAKGLVGMAGGLIIIGAALALVPPTSIFSAAAVMVVAASLSMIGDALNQMGNMEWETIGKGLVSLAGALLLISAAIILIPPTSLASAAAVYVVAMSLGMIAAALGTMGGMEWEEIGKSLVLLAGALVIIAAAMLFMVEALPGAAALLVVAFSLRVLLPVMQAFSEMTWGEIAAGLGMLAGVFIVLGLAGLILGPVVPVLLGLAAAIALLGIAMLAAGIGIAAFGIGLTLLAAAAATGTVAIVAMISALIALIPQVMKQIGLGIVAFAEVIATAAPAMSKAFVAVLSAILYAIENTTPRIVNTLLKMLSMLLSSMNQYVPRMVNSGMQLITGVLNGIANNIGKAVTAGVRVVTEFINGISKNIPRVIASGVNLILKFINSVTAAINANSAAMGVAGGNLAAAIIRGMVTGIGAGIGQVVDAAKRMAASAISAAMQALDSHSPSKEFIKVGETVNKGFIIGLDGNKEDIWKAFADLREVVTEARKAALEDYKKIQESLKKLNSARRKDVKAIKKAKAELAQARKEYQATGAAIDQINRLKVDKTKLGNLATQFDVLTEKIKNADQALKDATKTRDDYNKSIKDQYSDLADITPETKLVDYIAAFKKQIDDTKIFAYALQRLRDLGLNDQMYKELLSKGSAALPFISQILDGGKGSVDELNKLGSELGKTATALGSTASKELYQAGVDMAAGLLKGLQNQQAALEKQMDKLADAMVTSIKKKLGIKSPSKEFAKLGKFSGEGLAKGLIDSSAMIKKSAEFIGNDAVTSLQNTLSGLSNVINSDIDLNPTITPVLDLSNVKKNAGLIGSMLPGSSISVGSAYSKARDVSVEHLSTRATLAEETFARQGDSLTFVQNNNSPKALSSAEIYRQTKNQLSVAKGALTK